MKYQSNSKKLISNDEYRIIPQNRIIIHDTISDTNEDTIYTNPEGKRLMISSAIISHHGQALREDYGPEDLIPTCAFYMTDGIGDLIPPQRIQFYYRISKNQVITIRFEPALELRTGIVLGQVVANGVAGNHDVDTDFTFYGWVEDL